MAIVDRGDVDFMKDYLLQTDGWRSDKPIMLRAVERDCNLFQHCSGGLREDPDIVMAAMTEDSAVTVVRSVSNTWLTRHPQVVIKAVSIANRRSLRSIRTVIADELWQRPGIGAGLDSPRLPCAWISLSTWSAMIVKWH